VATPQSISEPSSSPAVVKTPGIHTDIILADFVGFSKMSDKDQYVAISLVSRLLSSVLEKLARDTFGKAMTMAIGWISTGDGFYIVLNPLAAGTGVFAALALRHVLLSRIITTVGLKGVRFAVHHGTAVPFDDVTGKRNYVGSGLNDCARLLSLRPEIAMIAKNFHRDDNTVAVSEQALDYLFTAYPREHFQNYLDVNGWRQSTRLLLVDKHEKEHRFYFIDHHRDNMIPIPKIMHPVLDEAEA